MQRNSERTGVYPPKLMHVPDLRYVYDAIQNDRITVAWKIEVATGPVSACPWGQTVVSAAGGTLVGYDYLGQMTQETLGAGVGSAKAYAYLALAPADIAWEEVYGLPYLHHATPALDDISGSTVVISPAVPGTGDERGTWSSAANAGDLVEFSYAVNTTNLHGDAYTDIASGSIDSDSADIVGTIDSTGAISITVVEITDAGDWLKFRFPDHGQVQVNNANGTINYTLSPLWMQQYGQRTSDIVETNLVQWWGANANLGGYVQLSGDVEQP